MKRSARKNKIIHGTGLAVLDIILIKGETMPLFQAGGTCANVINMLAYFGWDAQLELRREKQRLYAAGRFDNFEQVTDLNSVSLGESLKATQRLVLLGDPGAGKTTLVRWLVTAYLLKMKADPDFAELPDVATLPDKACLPVLIRCRELDESCFTGALDDILRQTLRKAQMTVQEADIYNRNLF
ncbi:MAG: hypothetical protein VSS75_027040 [Candidatus Parabeggiatoa sp.]|nr:hypothetical protein [Candidatus Parabeggiatoa sp.]